MLLKDEPGFGCVNRPVGDQGKSRPEITDSGVLVHGRLNSRIMLASQAVSCCRRIHGLSGVLLSSLSRSSEHPRVIATGAAGNVRAAMADLEMWLG